MENLMFVIGFISQWAKANPKVPNILVVLGVCAVGYVAYYFSVDGAMAHGFKAFLQSGFEYALRGVFALQSTSAVASGLSNLNLPAPVAKALPVTQK